MTIEWDATVPEPTPKPEAHEDPKAPPVSIDGASGPYAWRPPASDAIVPDQKGAAAAARTSKEEGQTDAGLQLRQVQGDRGGPTRRRTRSGDGGGVVRRGSERGLPRPGRADHGVRGGVPDEDLGRGRGEDRNGGPGLGLHPGEGGRSLVTPSPAPAPAPTPPPAPALVPRTELSAAEQERLEALQKRIAVRFRHP